MFAVESMYSAMCECQALHPDENDSLSAGCYSTSVCLLLVTNFLVVLVIKMVKKLLFKLNNFVCKSVLWM